MNPIEQFSKSISESPTAVKLSINGIWEDGWLIPFPQGQPSESELDKYLAKGTEGIAFQVFFTTDEGYNVILGVRYKEGLIPTTPKEFLTTAFTTIWSENTLTFINIISGLSQELTGNEETLFGIDPTGVELGVIGSWKSIGYLEIWDKSKSKSLSRKDLDQQIEQKPQFLEYEKSYVALELNYHTIPHYWLGIQVSDKRGERFILNRSRIEKLLKELLDITLI